MVEQIHPAHLADWFAHDRAATAIVLDVREPWELQLASVKPLDFTLRAIPMHEIPARLNELNPNARIACLCHHGIRSQQVAAFLNQQGFQHLANLAGGIEAWTLQLDHSVPRY